MARRRRDFFLLFLWFFVDFPLKNEAKLRKFRPRVQKVYLLASQKVNFLPFWNPKGKKVYPKRLKKNAGSHPPARDGLTADLAM